MVQLEENVEEKYTPTTDEIITNSSSYTVFMQTDKYRADAEWTPLPSYGTVNARAGQNYYFKCAFAAKLATMEV